MIKVSLKAFGKKRFAVICNENRLLILNVFGTMVIIDRR